MTTPEEFMHLLYGEMNHQLDEWNDEARVKELIRARDAEIAAEARFEALAPFDREPGFRDQHGRDHRLPAGASVDDVPDQVTRVNRLVGPWQAEPPQPRAQVGIPTSNPVKVTVSQPEPEGVKDVDPDEALGRAETDRLQINRLTRERDEAEKEIRRLRDNPVAREMKRQRDEAREVARSHVEDARDWRRRHEALRADVGDLREAWKIPDILSHAVPYLALDQVLTRDDERAKGEQ